MVIEFLKVHNAGNDFLLVDAIARPELASALDGVAASRLCHRQFGVGGDGLIVVTREGGTPRMTIWNSDGSRAKMCGNGLSCVARFLVERGYAASGEFGVATDSGIRVPRVAREADGAFAVRIDMGAPVLERGRIPMAGGDPGGRVVLEPLAVLDAVFPVTAVSMGNPHAVIHLPEGSKFDDLAKYGPALERHPLFPERVNVEFVTVLSRGEVRIDVWERGAGPTLACGTGTAAVAVAGILSGRTDARILAHLPGGDLTAEYAGGGSAFISCSPRVVFAASIDPAAAGR